MAVISGRVTDPEGNPIGDVLVSFDSFWTTTGPGGRYDLEVPSGDYTAKFVRRGYATVTRDVSVTRDMTVNATLRPT